MHGCYKTRHLKQRRPSDLPGKGRVLLNSPLHEREKQQTATLLTLSLVPMFSEDRPVTKHTPVLEMALFSEFTHLCVSNSPVGR
jgi:hypothetical protein